MAMRKPIKKRNDILRRKITATIDGILFEQIPGEMTLVTLGSSPIVALIPTLMIGP